MIDKQAVKAIVEEWIAQGDYQLIDLTVSADNRIVVEIDRFAGVDLDACVQLTRFIEDRLDREVEDYELEVGSTGLTEPFKVLLHYQKNIGNNVEVLTADGQKLHGLLVDANETEFLLETEQMVAVEGKKRKQKQVQTLTFAYPAVKWVRYDLKV